MRRAPAVLAAVLIVMSALSGCGDDSESLEGVAISGDLGEEPTVETTEDFKADGTQSAEVSVGDGAQLAKDSVVEAKIGVFDNEGTLVQGNYDRDENEQIDLAAAQAPWLGELVGAHVGSRVAVSMPVSEIVGPEGAPQAGLEPDEPMLFLVDVLEEAEGPLSGPEGKSVEPPADAPTVVEEDGKVTGVDFSDAPKDPPSELQVIPLTEGEGPEVEEGQQVTLNYLGVVWGEDEAVRQLLRAGRSDGVPDQQGQPHRRLGRGDPRGQGRQPRHADHPARPRLRCAGRGPGHPGQRHAGVRHRRAGRQLTPTW